MEYTVSGKAASFKGSSVSELYTRSWLAKMYANIIQSKQEGISRENEFVVSVILVWLVIAVYAGLRQTRVKTFFV